MDIQINNPESPISSEALDQLEARIAFRLPIEYREFLLTTNGGEPIRATLDYLGLDNSATETCLSHFFSVSDDPDKSLEINFRYYHDNDRIPQHALPIAIDIAGNLVCLSGSKVYFWDHELELEFDENLAPLASSLSEFFGKLH